MSNNVNDEWAWLKEKCIDCYEKNRYREIRNSVSAPFADGWILDLRYCEKHEKQMQELQEYVRKHG